MGGLMSGIEKSIQTNITDIINHTNSMTVNDIYEVNHNSFDGYQWIAALDSSTCAACANLDNKIFDLLPGMNIEKQGQTMPPDEPPLHHNCLLGDALISTCSKISSVSRRIYQGEIIVIHTARGNIIRCTPNHPILSDAGFIRAKDIKKGHNLVCDNGLKFIPISENKNHKVARIEDIFSSFRESSEMFSRTMKTSPEDFHGDVTNEEVNIISANRKLPFKLNFLFRKIHGKCRFIMRIMKYLFNIPCLRSFTFFIKRYISSFSRFMRFFCHLFYLFFSHVFHSFNLLLSTISKRNIVFFKNAYHFSSSKSKLISNSCNTDAGFIKCQNCFFRRNRNSSISITSNKISFKNIIDDVFGNTKLSRNILNRYAGKINFDSVITVDSVVLNTHVYNLETKNNWYVSNNIIEHNCRCVIIPVLEGMRDDPTQTKLNYKDWFEEQYEKTKLDILGPSRYKEYLFNGKKVTSFAKDGRVLSLNELGIDRITRHKLFIEISEIEDLNINKETQKNNSDDPYSPERINNAKWFVDKDAADEFYQKQLADIWQELSIEEKQSIIDYTGTSYSNVNKYLRLGKAAGFDEATIKEIQKTIDLLSGVLNKSALQQDTWVQRGVDASGIGKFLKLTNFSADEIFKNKKLLLNRKYEDLAFLSTSVVKGGGGGYKYEKFIFNIYLPKGTKALYVDPVSQYGSRRELNEKLIDWNPTKKHEVSNYAEMEMILQKGMQFKIVKIDKNNGITYIDLWVVNEEK